MYCESCGSFIPDGQSFCTNCGAPVAAQPAPQPAAAPVAAPAPAPAPAPQAVPVQPVYQQPAYQQTVQPVNVQPVYQQPTYAAPVSNGPVKAGNGAATAGLVFGIITIALFWVPFFNLFTTGICGLLGLIFSIIGLAKKNAGGKPKAIVGLILTIVGSILTVFYYYEIGQTIVSDPSLSREFEEIFEDTAAPEGYTFSEGEFITPDQEYVSGVLHIDGCLVEF